MITVKTKAFTKNTRRIRKMIIAPIEIPHIVFYKKVTINKQAKNIYIDVNNRATIYIVPINKGYICA
jgi:hypothetical protein